MIGPHYLVDLGALVQTFATSPRDAFAVACLAVFGSEAKAPPGPFKVYQFSADGEILEVLTAMEKYTALQLLIIRALYSAHPQGLTQHQIHIRTEHPSLAETAMALFSLDAQHGIIEVQSHMPGEPLNRLSELGKSQAQQIFPAIAAGDPAKEVTQ